MSRLKKLLLVSVVLALGVGLAWPFRKGAAELAPAKQTDVPDAIVSLDAVDSSSAPGRQVVAKMASTAESASTVPSQSGFDLKNHAALVSQSSRATSADGAAWPEEIIHIVHNRDTLEKLAERYLGDAGRALELFDLNRDQLTNPHLLPIGAELRIPVSPRRKSD